MFVKFDLVCSLTLVLDGCSSSLTGMSSLKSEPLHYKTNDFGFAFSEASDQQLHIPIGLDCPHERKLTPLATHSGHSKASDQNC